jgi:glutamate-5-semialdehyde dehydrogenase
MDIKSKATAARSASLALGASKAGLKNAALAAISKSLEARKSDIFAANDADLADATKAAVAQPLIKRLKFDDDKLREVLDGIASLESLPDPVGKTLSARELDRGLDLYQVASPIGVIGVIFESRPDALVQISTLCLKSGNSIILKGGSEARRTNRILADIIIEATKDAGLPVGWIQLIETREDVRDMLELDSEIDLIIPRGSNEFVRYIMDHTNIPVLGHADGICHAYVHADADYEQAADVVVDSKTQYVAVCNALETLLVHSDAASDFLPMVHRALEERNVLLKGCARTREIIDISAADDEDWSTEYLDLILSIRVVDGIEEAVDHINHYGSHHTDVILTSEKQTAEDFMTVVDSANVLWNCSTRFADGYRFGLGAEVGIGTGKIHARGPVGMEGLLIYKWKLFGSGQIVADYSGPDGKSFSHKPIAAD